MNHASTAFEICIQTAVFFMNFNSVLLNSKHNAYKNITNKNLKTQNSDSDKKINKNKQIKFNKFNKMIETLIKYIMKSFLIIHIINKN